MRYRVKAKHPRRDMPLRVTRRDGSLIAVSGELCDHCTDAEIASMLENGYIEDADAVQAEPAAAPQADGDDGAYPDEGRYERGC